MTIQKSPFGPTKHDLSRASDGLQRHRGSVHPELVFNYRPKSQLVIPKPNSIDAYGDLTDTSSYSEYAWAFLKRNRFYQAMIDKAVPGFRLEQWGYVQKGRDQRDVEPSFGLMRLKHYCKGHSEGTAVEWFGIQSFQMDLDIACTMKKTSVQELDFPTTQLSLTFDLGPILGPGVPALDIQIKLAHRKLTQFMELRGVSEGKRKNEPNRRILRAQLRIADLLSSPKDPTFAIEKLKARGEVNQPRRESPLTTSEKLKLLQGPTITGIKEVAKLIPEFDLLRKRSERLSNEQQVKRASELAIAAFRSIYQWQCLNWLQFDDWCAWQERRDAERASATQSRKN